MRTSAACAPLVLAVLLVAVPVGAVDRVARSSNVVVRERPGSAHPGIAILERGDRVRFFGERDGWTEVGLRDGRSGWVLSAEIAPVAEPPPPNPPTGTRVSEAEPTAGPAATSSVSEAAPTATTTPSPASKMRVSEPVPTPPAPRADGESSLVEHGRTLARLETEIGQLRRSVDRLVADPPLSAPRVANDSTDVPWTSPEALITCAVAFAIGLIVGSVVQRRRSRRERTLRF
jgi:hypothetical protein